VYGAGRGVYGTKLKIPDDQLAQLKTVSDAVDYIAKNQ
jgi:acyl carrier protein